MSPWVEQPSSFPVFYSICLWWQIQQKICWAQHLPIPSMSRSRCSALYVSGVSKDEGLIVETSRTDRKLLFQCMLQLFQRQDQSNTSWVPELATVMLAEDQRLLVLNMCIIQPILDFILFTFSLIFSMKVACAFWHMCLAESPNPHFIRIIVIF